MSRDEKQGAEAPKAAYQTPEIVSLGDAALLTEGSGTPVAETPGSGLYYNANPPAEVTADEDALPAEG